MVNYEARKVGDVKGLGIVYQVNAPLDEQISAFKRAGVEHPYLVTPEETATIRLAGMSNDFTRTSMAPVGVKGENPILYRASPLMNPAMASLAVIAHRNGKRFALPREFYEAVRQFAEEDRGLEPEDRRAIVLSSAENYSLTPEMEDTRFILGKPMQKYFDRFKHTSIPFLNLETKDVSKNECAVNYLWFNRPDNDSQLYARNRYLDNEHRAFGVRRDAVSNAQNSGYSLTEIGKASSEVIPVVFDNEGVRGLTPLVARGLSKGLLERLRTGRQ